VVGGSVFFGLAADQYDSATAALALPPGPERDALFQKHSCRAEWLEAAGTVSVQMAQAVAISGPIGYCTGYLVARGCGRVVVPVTSTLAVLAAGQTAWETYNTDWSKLSGPQTLEKAGELYGSWLFGGLCGASSFRSGYAAGTRRSLQQLNGHLLDGPAVCLPFAPGRAGVTPRASRSVLVASEMGEQGSAPMQLYRRIEPGEPLDKILNELKALTWEKGKEHAVVSFGNRERWIVFGGPTGIDLPTGQVRRLIVHTHPPRREYMLGPSPEDFAALRQLGRNPGAGQFQQHGYILQRGLIFRYNADGTFEIVPWPPRR